ncbi:MAG: hypothetical protein IJ646_11795 [Clostridia bacterium]|nr:hypothetical protein [Clostridia bacterium]
MNETIQLLQDVVRSARTGEEAIGQLIGRAESPEMRGELDRELHQYQSAARQAESALAAAGGQPEPVGLMQKAGMWAGTQMNTLTDRSNAHIAEMVIQGATMGIIELTKARNTCPDADPGAAGIASRFIVEQNDIIERQKAYLKEPALV